MMGAARGRNTLPTILALTCAALAAVLAVEAYTSPEAPVPVVPAPVVADDDAGQMPPQTYPAKPLDSYAEIAERPVFSSSRRPSPAARKSTDGAGRSGHDNLMLAGVIMLANKRLAMIETKKSASVVMVREGQAVEGWTIDSIAAEKVVISQGNEVFELLLDDRLKAPRKQVRRTPRTAPAAPASSPSAADSPPARAPAPAAPPDGDAPPPRDDGGGEVEELTE